MSNIEIASTLLSVSFILFFAAYKLYKPEPPLEPGETTEERAAWRHIKGIGGIWFQILALVGFFIFLASLKYFGFWDLFRP
ncbi:MAG: hypothetical protein CME70_04525 [Halobacteriovorax sp.]|nr:hypothetical protein [Halobacteriovorax sp.]|tara:strand:+ start:4996 stop:5238 length:243 start_codon:yes stop_codon:yes gene_type:complete